MNKYSPDQLQAKKVDLLKVPNQLKIVKGKTAHKFFSQRNGYRSSNIRVSKDHQQLMLSLVDKSSIQRNTNTQLSTYGAGSVILVAKNQIPRAQRSSKVTDRSSRSTNQSVFQSMMVTMGEAYKDNEQQNFPQIPMVTPKTQEMKKNQLGNIPKLRSSNITFVNVATDTSSQQLGQYNDPEFSSQGLRFKSHQKEQSNQNVTNFNQVLVGGPSLAQYRQTSQIVNPKFVQQNKEMQWQRESNQSNNIPQFHTQNKNGGNVKQVYTSPLKIGNNRNTQSVMATPSVKLQQDFGFDLQAMIYECNKANQNDNQQLERIYEENLKQVEMMIKQSAVVDSPLTSKDLRVHLKLKPISQTNVNSGYSSIQVGSGHVTPGNFSQSNMQENRGINALQKRVTEQKMMLAGETQQTPLPSQIMMPAIGAEKKQSSLFAKRGSSSRDLPQILAVQTKKSSLLQERKTPNKQASPQKLASPYLSASQNLSPSKYQLQSMKNLEGKRNSTTGLSNSKAHEKAVQEMLESPTWKHRQIKVDIKPFDGKSQLDKHIKKIQKKDPSKKKGKSQLMNMDKVSLFKSDPIQEEAAELLMRDEPSPDKLPKYDDDDIMDFEHYVQFKKQVSNYGYASPSKCFEKFCKTPLKNKGTRASAYKNSIADQTPLSTLSRRKQKSLVSPACFDGMSSPMKSPNKKGRTSVKPWWDYNTQSTTKEVNWPISNNNSIQPLKKKQTAIAALKNIYAANGYKSEKVEMENRLLRMQAAKQDANSLRLHSYKTAGQSLAIERVERRKRGARNSQNSWSHSNDESEDEDYGSELDEVEEESPSLHVASATEKGAVQYEESYYEESPMP